MASTRCNPPHLSSMAFQVDQLITPIDYVFRQRDQGFSSTNSLRGSRRRKHWHHDGNTSSIYRLALSDLREV